MSKEFTPYERIKAMVEGREVDRPGASVWKHFHQDDRVVSDSVKAHIAFQEKNQWDFIKIMANGIHIQEQYGAKIRWSRDGIEFPTTLVRYINSPKEFRNLKKVDIHTGAVAREVEVAKRLKEYYDGKVPVVATVFSPLTYAQELYNGFQDPARFIPLVREYGDDLKEGLKVLTEVTRDIVEAYANAGVDGIFYSTQFANDSQITSEEYDEFAIKSDLEGFEPAVGKTWFNILHIHGDSNLYFDKFLDFPFEAFNWQSTITNVSLSDAARKTDKILIGGIERESGFDFTSREELKEKIRKNVKDAIDSVPANRLIIAPGCALPNELPEFRFNVLKEVIDELYPNT